MPRHDRWREHSGYRDWRPSSNVRCVDFSPGSRQFALYTPFRHWRFWPLLGNFSGWSDGTCTRSNLASVISAGSAATVGGAMVGDGADESATAGVSADTGLSGCGIFNTAMKMRAKPVGNAIHPAHPAAGITRRRICWSRDLGPGSDGDGSTSPCHSHKPVSLVSVLINAAGGDIGAFPVAIGALPYAWPINSPASACMAHNPFLVAAPISSVHSVRRPRTGSGRIGIATAQLVGDGHRRSKHHRVEAR